MADRNVTAPDVPSHTQVEQLRCRAGDIAWGSVRSRRNPSRLVRVVRRYYPGELVDGLLFETFGDPSWVIESLGSPFVYPDGESRQVFVCGDRILTPLRDSDGQESCGAASVRGEPLAGRVHLT